MREQTLSLFLCKNCVKKKVVAPFYTPTSVRIWGLSSWRHTQQTTSSGIGHYLLRQVVFRIGNQNAVNVRNNIKSDVLLFTTLLRPDWLNDLKNTQ